MNAYRKEVDAKHNATVRKAMTGMPLETALLPVPFHAYARASCSYLCAPRTCRLICTTQCAGSCLRTYIPLVSRPYHPPSLLRLIQILGHDLAGPCLSPSCRHRLKPCEQGKVPASVRSPSDGAYSPIHPHPTCIHTRELGLPPFILFTSVPPISRKFFCVIYLCRPV
jgi:hypothetical protein